MLNLQLEQTLAMRAEGLYIDFVKLTAEQQILWAECCYAGTPRVPLYIENPPQPCHLQEQDQFVTESHATKPLVGVWADEQALLNLDEWLEAGHRHFIAPAAVAPVVRALMNIWELDPYLMRHYLNELRSLLVEAHESNYLAVFRVREDKDAICSDWVHRYLKLERRLHRSYLDH